MLFSPRHLDDTAEIRAELLPVFIHLLHALLYPCAVLHLSCQLAASGIDIVATRLANRRDDTRVDQYLSECLDANIVGAYEAGLREGIEGNQVELAGNRMRGVFYQRDQFTSMLVGVVDAIKHAVFESNEVSRREFKVSPCGRHQLGQWIFLVQRDEAVT